MLVAVGTASDRTDFTFVGATGIGDCPALWFTFTTLAPGKTAVMA